MCESNDFLKEDGVFVCQSCGTKYSVEEAKKMIGTTEINATAQIGNTGKLDNLYKLARKAKDEGNIDKAAQYYEQIYIEDLNNWEAAFYSAYFSSMLCQERGETDKAIFLLRDCIDSVMDIIKNTIENKEAQEAAVKEVAVNAEDLCIKFMNTIKSELDNFNLNYFDSMNTLNARVILPKIRDYWQTITNKGIAISQTFAQIGFKTYELFDDNEKLDYMGDVNIDQAIKALDICSSMNQANLMDYYKNIFNIFEQIVGKLNCTILSDSEKKNIIDSYKARKNNLIEQKSKRRLEEYWNNHQSEKAGLESEKKSLIEQIDALNKETCLSS